MVGMTIQTRFVPSTETFGLIRQRITPLTGVQRIGILTRLTSGKQLYLELVRNGWDFIMNPDNFCLSLSGSGLSIQPILRFSATSRNTPKLTRHYLIMLTTGGGDRISNWHSLSVHHLEETQRMCIGAYRLSIA